MGSWGSGDHEEISDDPAGATAHPAQRGWNVARRVGDTLRRPVVSYADGREIVITFGQQVSPGLGPDPAAGLACG